MNPYMKGKLSHWQWRSEEGKDGVNRPGRQPGEDAKWVIKK